MKKTKTSRRKFIKTTGAAAAGFMIVPRHVLGGKGYTPPSDRLNIAGIGVGGRGFGILNGAYNNGAENIVALCDVDDRRAKRAYEAFPKAKRYKDFRKMLAKEKGNIDAVMIGTPDHTHAVAALAAMRLEKHVYVEKPLTHNIAEARALTEAAQQYKVVTQMGNQGASGDGVRRIQEWINAGVIGEVERVHCFTNRPVWPQGKPTPTEKHKIPKELDWDLWLGPAPMKDYHDSYLPFKWRGWWDWGTGALGDMGCHIIDPPFKALNLGYPTEAEASVGQVWVGDFVVADFPDSCPPSSKVHLKFPARGDMPEVELVWYDGGIMPKMPDELADGEMLGDSGGGCLFEGTRGKIMCGTYGRNPTLLPTKSMKYFNEPEPTIARIPNEDHQQNWIKAIKEGGETTSPFSYAGPLTEAVLMGNLAIRSYNYRDENKKYPGRKKLFWDGDTMKILNFDIANQFVTRTYRDGWILDDM